jgi:hypothetical protein
MLRMNLPTRSLDASPAHLLVAGLVFVLTSVFPQEPLDATSGVHVFHLAGEKRMARGANFDVNFPFGAAGLERIATTAGYRGLDVFRMDTLFHRCCLLLLRLPTRRGSPQGSLFVRQDNLVYARPARWKRPFRLARG